MDLWLSILNNTATVSLHFICLHYSFMLILIDEDTLKKEGRRKEGETNTLTLWSLIPVNLQFILQEYYSKEMFTTTFWEGFFSFYQSLFFLKDWKWGTSSASDTYLITAEAAHHTAISQENQCWSF